MELRNRVRYRLSADAVFAWEGAQQGQFLGEGLTRDISIAGAFIFTPTSPPVGAIVQVDVFLSRTVDGAKKAVRIRTEATVIRVEHSAATEGFAAVSKDFTLLFEGGTRSGFCVSNVEKVHGAVASD